MAVQSRDGWANRQHNAADGHRAEGHEQAIQHCEQGRGSLDAIAGSWSQQRGHNAIARDGCLGASSQKALDSYQGRDLDSGKVKQKVKPIEKVMEQAKSWMQEPPACSSKALTVLRSDASTFSNVAQGAALDFEDDDDHSPIQSMTSEYGSGALMTKLVDFYLQVREISLSGSSRFGLEEHLADMISWLQTKIDKPGYCLPIPGGPG